jgi:hypothetical protein
MAEIDILKNAAEALLEHDRRQQAVRDSDNVLRALCRLWGDSSGRWAVSPVHLRRECQLRGLLNESQQT